MQDNGSSKGLEKAVLRSSALLQGGWRRFHRAATAVYRHTVLHLGRQDMGDWQSI